jgi:putative PEP-CTERM system histidine kinase
MIFDVSAVAGLHGICALAYGLLSVLILVGLFSGVPEGYGNNRTGIWLAVACLATALWAGSVAAFWGSSLMPIAVWLDLAHTVAWYGFILHLYRQSVTAPRQMMQAFTTMGLLAVLLVGGLPLMEAMFGQPAASLASLGPVVKLGFAVSSLLLLENLYLNTAPDARWHINLLCIALGGLFLFDVLMYSDALLFRRLSLPLFAGRAPATTIAAPLIALAAARARRWKIDIHVSRDVVFHSFTLIAAGIFLVSIAVTGEIVRRGGAEWGYVAEVTLIFASLLTVAVLLTSGSVRSRLRILFVDHFFSARYDYRREWMRCIDTLTAPEAHVGLHKRAIQAVAQVVDSPAGVLFVRAPEDVAFQWAGSLNMPAATEPISPGNPLVPLFREGDWIVVLDEMPEARIGLANLPRAWLVVPLSHFGSLIGFVVLAESRASFKLEREAYDLLRVVGREVASRVAEQRAAQILDQTRQLREYSQRFAFVIHDIKNVSGQLSMLLTNAEVHADNPEFQRDMLVTVRASVGKITRLLTRLQADRQERSHTLVAPLEHVVAMAEVCRMTRSAAIAVRDDGHKAGIAIDPEAFDAVLTHLLNNAAEASGDRIVTVVMRHENMNIVIDIADRGPGMAPEFVRDELFRPFSTTKGEGHGIGAYQARELLREAGGDLLVLTRMGEGTTMRLLLPAVPTGVVVPAALEG